MQVGCFSSQFSGLLGPTILGLSRISHCLAKSQLNKSNLTRTKLENLARELQKVRHTIPLAGMYN